MDHILASFKKPHQGLLAQGQAEEADSTYSSYAGPVRNFAQICAAFRLVHQHYVSHGYMKPSATCMRYSIFELLPSSMMFVRMDQAGVVEGTLGVVMDSFSGLPCGNVFQHELDRERATGRTIAEATMFACRRASQDGASNSSCMDLIKWVFAWCCVYGVHDLFVVVNPRHRLFWVKIAGFEEVAEARPCPHVCDAPGVLLRMNIESVLSGEQKATRFIKKIMCDSGIDPAAFVDDYLPSEEEMIDLFLKQPQIFSGMNRYQRVTISTFFPLAFRTIETLFQVYGTSSQNGFMVGDA